MNRFTILSKIIKGVIFTFSFMIGFSSCHHHDLFVYDESFSKGENTEFSSEEEDGNTKIKAGSTIGVYVIDQDGNVTFRTVEVDEHGNAVLPAVPDGTGFVAYLPYQEDWNQEDVVSPKIFTVQPSQTTQELYDASDLMFGSKGVRSRASSQFTFRHALSKIIVEITDETEAYNLSESVLTLLDMNDTVEVFLKWLIVETLSEYSHDIITYNYKTEGQTTFFTAIAAPQTLKSGVSFINLTANGRQLAFNLPGKEDLQSGKTFTCSLRLTDIGLIYDGSSISDWEDDGGDSFDMEW